MALIHSVGPMIRAPWVRLISVNCKDKPSVEMIRSCYNIIHVLHAFIPVCCNIISTLPSHRVAGPKSVRMNDSNDDPCIGFYEVHLFHNINSGSNVYLKLRVRFCC
jgi:hypothetical protein